VGHPLVQVRIPQPAGAILAGGGDGVVVRAERDRGDGTGVSGQRWADRAAGVRVPQCYCLEQNQAIREWAQKQGLKVSERGRISEPVLDAFKAAH
jgi:Lsr2